MRGPHWSMGLTLGLALVGCADEGITHLAGPYPVKVADAGKPKPAVKDAGASAPDEDPPAAESQDEADASVDEPVDSEPVSKPDAGPRDAGSVPVEEADAGSTPAEPALPPCPTGYECKDPAGPLAEMGLSGTITDPDGNQVMYSCAKGGQETCDQKDPKKSCPNFSKPYCAHLKLTGLLAVDLYQCAQDCTP